MDSIEKQWVILEEDGSNEENYVLLNQKQIHMATTSMGIRGILIIVKSKAIFHSHFSDSTYAQCLIWIQKKEEKRPHDPEKLFPLILTDHILNYSATVHLDATSYKSAVEGK